LGMALSIDRLNQNSSYMQRIVVAHLPLTWPR
jgi:hypothetical protein